MLVPIPSTIGLMMRGNVNPRHTWAMQPITLKIANSEGFADFENGLQADHRLQEDVTNLGTLGEIDEPLLEKTLEVMGILPAKIRKKSTFYSALNV